MFPNIFMKVSELIALVLCGGESRRMGRDKGLMLKDGMPWAQYIGQRLASYGRVFYSIHPRQREAYAAVLPADRLIVDSLDIPGPLNGLLSAHVVMPESDILLVACDMLDMDPATLDRLVSAWQGVKPIFMLMAMSGCGSHLVVSIPLVDSGRLPDIPACNRFYGLAGRRGC